jgi:hypothetical protein
VNANGGGPAANGAGGGGSRRKRRRGQGKSGGDGPELWRRTPDLEPPQRVELVDESGATAMLRSLGPPPLPGQDPEHAMLELSKVVVRASQLAGALAAAADLLASDDEDDAHQASDADGA